MVYIRQTFELIDVISSNVKPKVPKTKIINII